MFIACKCNKHYLFYYYFASVHHLRNIKAGCALGWQKFKGQMLKVIYNSFTIQFGFLNRKLTRQNYSRLSTWNLVYCAYGRNF